MGCTISNRSGYVTYYDREIVFFVILSEVDAVKIGSIQFERVTEMAEFILEKMLIDNSVYFNLNSDKIRDMVSGKCHSGI